MVCLDVAVLTVSYACMSMPMCFKLRLTWASYYSINHAFCSIDDVIILLNMNAQLC